MFNEVDTIIHFNTLFVSLIVPVLMLDATYIIIFIALGIGGGLFGSIIGVGGGIIFTPILTLIGLPPAQISSTSLMAVTFTSISSVISYARHRRIKYRIACRIALLSMPGAILGVYLSTVISIGLFKMFFSIILIIAVIYILFNGSTKNEKGKKKIQFNPYPLLYSCAFAAGIVSSLFGVGGGIIFVPMLLILMSMKMYEAAPTSQFIIMVSAATGLVIHAIMGNPNYVFAMSLAVGAFVGGAIGAELSGHLRENFLRIFLSISLLFVSGRLIFDVIDDL
jgi:uncharacterized protein